MEKIQLMITISTAVSSPIQTQNILNSLDLHVFHHHISIAELNSYFLAAQKPLCNAMLPGIIEILTIAAILGVFNVLNTILGICFVIRNEIDVPVYKEEREYKSVY